MNTLYTYLTLFTDTYRSVLVYEVAVHVCTNNRNLAAFVVHYDRTYNEANMKEALEWMDQNIHADWGGTEIFSVLEAIYRMPLKDNSSRQVMIWIVDIPHVLCLRSSWIIGWDICSHGIVCRSSSIEGFYISLVCIFSLECSSVHHLHQIILLTDGGVSGDEEGRIFDLVQGRGDVNPSISARTTVFTLGIGHGVHRGLVEGMAKRVSHHIQYYLLTPHVHPSAHIMNPSCAEWWCIPVCRRWGAHREEGRDAQALRPSWGQRPYQAAASDPVLPHQSYTACASPKVVS